MSDKPFETEYVSQERIDRAKKTKEKYEKESKIKNIDGSEFYAPEWIDLNSVTAKSQPWFWLGMIPAETLTLFAGYGGIGKSLLLLYIVAHTTNEQEYNAGGLTHKLPQGSVILLSAEDDVETQIKPKLIAFGADLTKVHIIKFKTSTKTGKRKFLELDKDLHILKEKIEEVKDVKLIIYDPITYFLGNVRDHYNSEVANFLQMQIDLAKASGTAIILNKHLRKPSTTGKGGSAQDEVAGCGSWINSPRKCWLISNWHEDADVKVLSNLKDNLSKKTQLCLAYKIETTTIQEGNETIETAKLIWLDHLINLNSDDAVASKEQYAKSKHDQCIDFIFKYISDHGQSRGSAIKDAAIEKGYGETTYKKALCEFKTKYANTLKEEHGINNQKTYRFIED